MKAGEKATEIIDARSSLSLDLAPLFSVTAIPQVSYSVIPCWFHYYADREWKERSEREREKGRKSG